MGALYGLLAVFYLFYYAIYFLVLRTTQVKQVMWHLPVPMMSTKGK